MHLLRVKNEVYWGLNPPLFPFLHPWRIINVDKSFILWIIRFKRGCRKAIILMRYVNHFDKGLLPAGLAQDIIQHVLSLLPIVGGVGKQGRHMEHDFVPFEIIVDTVKTRRII